MTYRTSITPLAAASRNSSGVSSALDLGAATTTELLLDVTVASGLTLDVSVETARSSAATDWREVDRFEAATGVSDERKTFVGLDRYIRVRWTITGTATFSVSGESVLVYCRPEDMRRVISEASFQRDQGIEWEDVELDGYAQDASDEIDEHLGAVFELPLTAWGRNVRMKTAQLAVYFAMRQRGFPPEDQGGKFYMSLYGEIMAWGERVRNQKTRLPGVTDSTPTIEDGGAYVVTSASRGW